MSGIPLALLASISIFHLPEWNSYSRGIPTVPVESYRGPVLVLVLTLVRRR